MVGASIQKNAVFSGCIHLNDCVTGGLFHNFYKGYIRARFLQSLQEQAAVMTDAATVVYGDAGSGQSYRLV